MWSVASLIVVSPKSAGRVPKKWNVVCSPRVLPVLSCVLALFFSLWGTSLKLGSFANVFVK